MEGFMFDRYLLIYFCLVGISGAATIWWVRKKITTAETQRSRRLKRISSFEPVNTETPLENPFQTAKKLAAESVATRFTIIRKISLLVTIAIWVIAFIFPFLQAIPATLVSILVGASGIILGIASRPFIENLISGVVISFSHPVRTGDTVIIDGNYGTIEDITITHTVLKIWNWRRYIIPNSQMLVKEIVNCTINDPYQWVHVEFFVSYDHEPDDIEALAMEAASGSQYFSDYEEPRFWIMEMTTKGYKCWIAGWVDSPGNAWEFGHDVRTRLISRFHSRNIKAHGLEVRLAGDRQQHSS